jgi:hypothetical protein
MSRDPPQKPNHFLQDDARVLRCDSLFTSRERRTANGVEVVRPAGFANCPVLFSGQPAIGHSVDLMNGRRFFAAPPSPPSRRYFDRFDRLLEGSSQTIDFASTFVP